MRTRSKSMDRGEAEEEAAAPISRDIRHYYCEYCGLCRSKKGLISTHIANHHKEEMEIEEEAAGDGEEGETEKSNTCKKCGASFKKPAHLKQHLQSHSLERPFTCLVDDCRSSFRRKDHLNRHLLQHQGKIFKCPIENCNRGFVCQGNMRRHVKELHIEDGTYVGRGQKQHMCQEIGCGKVFQFASKLRKHEESHVKLDSVEAFCSEPDCMKYFSNEQCLKAHIQSCHQHINCEICGAKQLKRNIKRHLLMHEGRTPSVERIKCSYKDCLLTFSNKSNLTQHVKAVHLEHKPFVCSISGCGKRFAYKHVRDNHEKTGLHVYEYGDFEEADEQFQSRPRGGRKRTCPTIEMLARKRVAPPDQLGLEPEYLSWLLSQEAEDQN